jgi:hypothetical protein
MHGQGTPAQPRSGAPGRDRHLQRIAASQNGSDFLGCAWLHHQLWGKKKIFRLIAAIGFELFGVYMRHATQLLKLGQQGSRKVFVHATNIVFFLKIPCSLGLLPRPMTLENEGTACLRLSFHHPSPVSLPKISIFTSNTMVYTSFWVNLAAI